MDDMPNKVERIGLFKQRRAQIIGGIILAILIILFMSNILSHLNYSGNSDSVIQTSSPSPTINQNCLSSSSPLKKFPIDLSKISTVVPLGNIAPPSHDFPVPHIYVNYVTNRDGSSPVITFQSPANINIDSIGIIAVINDSNNNQTYYDYKVSFSLCNGQLSSYILHIYALDPFLLTSIGTIDEQTVLKTTNGHETWGPGINVSDTNFNKRVDVNLKEGDVIGIAGGIKGMSTNFDFGLSDSQIFGRTADPSIWSQNDDNYVCPIDYFDSSTKEILYSKIGGFEKGEVPTIDNQCGQVYQDKVDTAQGVWVTKGTNTSGQSIWELNPHVLSLVHNNLDTSYGMVGFSSDVQESLGLNDTSAYIFAPGSMATKVNVPFGQVSDDGNIYCYQTKPLYSNPGQYGISFILQMIDSKTLRIGNINSIRCGVGPWKFTKFLDFVR